MKNLRIPLVILVSLAMTSWLIPSAGTYTASAQAQTTALERGYRTGYSDGYNAGYRDISDQAARDPQGKDEYKNADRNYNAAWGPVEDYRDGYQQGFEAGYAAGYERRMFNSTIPVGLTRRGVVDSEPQAADNSPDDSAVSSTAPGGPAHIQRDAILLVEMLQSLSTDASQPNDRFQARVLDPRELEGAIVEGRVISVMRPGKVRGTAELQLSFESIRMPDNRSADISAQVVELVGMGNRDEEGRVDPEGGVRGKDTTKDDISKVGASTGIAAMIGAIFGGGKGAAIGAAIGASVGTAGVLTTRGKDLRIAQGQQLKIRIATDASLQGGD